MARRLAARGSRQTEAVLRRAGQYDGVTLNHRDGPPVPDFKMNWLRSIRAFGAFLFILVAGCAQQPMTSGGPEIGRYLVYFNEFSADLSPDALNVIGEAAKYAKENGARVIRVEGRASATGSEAANQKLTETRTQVVYDALQKDGVNPAIIQQQPLGQTTTTDVSVMERRVDIVLLK
jgi:outer membrane protein OmpA-like peptidoglycan-associated protein